MGGVLNNMVICHMLQFLLLLLDLHVNLLLLQEDQLLLLPQKLCSHSFSFILINGNLLNRWSLKINKFKIWFLVCGQILPFQQMQG